jgi:hypothetical protein
MSIFSFYLAGIIIFIGSIYLRSVARLINRNFGIDTWYYLLYAEDLRQHKRLPASIPFYLLDKDKQFYPPGFPIFLSLFPKELLLRYHWLINPFIDSLQALLLYVFTFSVTSDLTISIFAVSLYVFSPILITQSSNLNSRMFGSLLLTVILLSGYGFITTNNIWLFVICVLFGIILSFSHKMTMQQLIFLVIGFCIAKLDFIYFFIFAVVLFFNFILGRKFYLNILRAHVEIVKFWSRNLPFLGAHQVYDSVLYKKSLKANGMKCVQGLRGSRLYFNLEKVIIVSAFLVVILLFLISRHSSLKGVEMMFYWAFINYFTIFSTSFLPGLKNLGEGHKYLSYGVFPLSFLLAYGIFSNLSYATALIFLSVFVLANVFVSVYIIKVQSKNTLASVDNNLVLIFDTIKKMKKDNIMCLPFSKADAVAYFTRKKVLFGGHSLGWERLGDFWPVLKKSVEFFIEEYNISCILIDDRYVKLDDLQLKISFKTIEKKGNYQLIEIGGCK